jgi:hypothetical protein
MPNSLTNFRKELATARLASTLTNNAANKLGVASKNNAKAALNAAASKVWANRRAARIANNAIKNAANAANTASKAAVKANNAAVAAVNAAVAANAAPMPGGKRRSKRVTARRNKRKCGTRRN